MEQTTIGLAAAAIVFALVAIARNRALSARVEELDRDMRRRLRNLSEDEDDAPGGADLRRIVAALADDAPLTGEMVMEGRLWHEVEAAEGLAMITSGGVHVIDVRTPSETAGGVLPEALLIPLDELEQRNSEIPRDGKPTLIYCAMGARSAAACEYLSNQGFSGLHNLAGGIGAWTGAVVQP